MASGFDRTYLPVDRGEPELCWQTPEPRTGLTSRKSGFPRQSRKAWLRVCTLVFPVLVVPLAGAGEQRPASPLSVDAPPRAVQEAGPTTALIAGVVRAPGGTLVPGAAVTVTETASGERKETWSDEAGSYRLAGLKPGIYNLEVSLVGFQSEVRESLSVTAGETTQVNLALRIATRTKRGSEAPREKSSGSRLPNLEALPEQVPQPSAHVGHSEPCGGWGDGALIREAYAFPKVARLLAPRPKEAWVVRPIRCRRTGAPAQPIPFCSPGASGRLRRRASQRLKCRGPRSFERR
jgi:hypothetical protein